MPPFRYMPRRDKSPVPARPLGKLVAFRAPGQLVSVIMGARAPRVNTFLDLSRLAVPYRELCGPQLLRVRVADPDKI